MIKNALSFLFIILSFGTLALIYRWQGAAKIQAQLVSEADPQATRTAPLGFARAEGPRPLSFPKDLGAHPDYQTEWWYYTGNLVSVDGRHFGYQLTFFRRALLPPSQRQTRASHWGADQVYLAHFALTDVQRDQHQAFERYSRGSAGLAGAESPPFQVWLRDWSVAQLEEGVYRLQANHEDLGLDLVLRDKKGIVLQGDQGYSHKGPQPGNASFYLSQTRLDTAGIIQTGEGSFVVKGSSWMDHEFSTSALSPGQVGWDWFALQLDDGSELMVFTLRREDGSIDPFSSGTIVYPDGTWRTLTGDDFQVKVLDAWRSPETGATYPAQWMIEVPGEGLELEVLPYIADQELNLRYKYWEGAVRIQGKRRGKPVAGDGYVELTGYAGSFAGEF
jgi:predicted secreted hydrolase